MAGENDNPTTTTTTDPGAEGGAAQDQTQEELARERKRANDAYALMRKQEQRLRELEAKIEKQPTSTSRNTNNPITGEDPEPDADSDPIGWMKWSRREDQRKAESDRQRNEMLNLNTFGQTSEAIARQQVPDYDKAMEYLREDYRRELEDSGELDFTAAQAMNDPQQRSNIISHASARGVSELEAAKDLVAAAAWEWRRQRIVAAQQRLGGNPALKAVEMAKKRGWAGQSSGGGTTTGVVDDVLKELERKKNLRAAGNTTADVRDGGEPREKRAWNYDQLAELKRTNPAEFRKVIAEIATDADSDPSVLNGVIRH